MSRFEDMLLANFHSKVDSIDRWCAKLDWATYRVRIGDLESIDDILANARNSNVANVEARLYSRINYLEGLYQFFRVGIQSALPKLLRARAIASGCERSDQTYALVNSWLASIYRNLGDWVGMTQALAALVESECAKTVEVRFRLYLVLGDICQEVELYEQASIWYGLARDSALKLGDDAALSAMLYNRASITIYNLRLQYVGGGFPRLNDGRVALEAASAQNYTHYINDQSLPWGFDLMSGQLLMLKGEAQAALDLFTAKRVEDALEQWPEVNALREADIFRCRSLLQDRNALRASEVVESAQDLLKKIEFVEAPGDQAIAIHSIAVGLREVDPSYEKVLLKMSTERLALVIEDRSREMEEFVRFISLYGDRLERLEKQK